MQNNEAPSPEPADPPALSCPSWPYLDEAAAHAGIAPENYLLASAVVLTGIAGPLAAWQGSQGWEPVSPVSMVTPAGALRLRQHLRQLLAIPLNLQDLLRMRSSQFPIQTLEMIRFGLTRDLKAHGAQALSLPAFQSHQSALLLRRDSRDHHLEAALMEDLTSPLAQIREEALFRPSFIVDGVDLGKLPAALLECHARTGLVLGTATNLVLTKAGKGAAPLADLLRGMEVEVPLGKGLQTAGRLIRVQASAAVMTASPAELGTLLKEAPASLHHFIVPGDDGRIIPPESGTLAAIWVKRDGAVAKEIIDLRRQGRGFSAGMRDQDKQLAFERDRLDFLSELEELQEPERYLAFAGLPTALAWTLCTRGADVDWDTTILGLAVPVARLLLHRHRAQLQLLATAHEHRKQPQHEFKVVDRIRRFGPMSDRDLVRGFNCQRMEEHRPTIERLLREGVLARDPQGKLILGDAANAGTTRTNQPAPRP